MSVSASYCINTDILTGQWTLGKDRWGLAWEPAVAHGAAPCAVETDARVSRVAVFRELYGVLSIQHGLSFLEARALPTVQFLWSLEGT